MKKLILFIIVVTAGNNFIFAQLTESEYHQVIFGDVFENHTETNFLIDLTDRLSKIEAVNGSENTPELHFEEWLKIYQEFKSAAIQPVNYPSLPDLYSDALDNRLDGKKNIYSFPIGVIFKEYDVLLPNAMDDGMVYIDNNDLTIRVNQGYDPVKQETLFASAIMVDTMYNVDVFELNFNPSFVFADQDLQSLKIYHNGVLLGDLNIHSNISVRPSLGRNEITVELERSNQPNLISKNYFINKDMVGISSKSGAVFSENNIINTPQETFFANNVSAGIKIFYGCNNTENKIQKPFIISSGYNPLNIEQFFMLINKFNSNGLLDELHRRNYDIVVVRYNNGSGRIEPNADVLIEIIKEINTRKWSNKSFYENLTMGYSSGALGLRAALKKMEVAYQNNPVQENLHHCKLYLSYDSEHQGANIPLSAQHSLFSLSLNSPIAADLGFLIFILNQTALIGSGQAKDFLKYHYTQTGSASSPNQAPHPFFTDFFGKFQNQFFYQEPPFDRPGDYAQIRNVAIAQGSANAQLHPLNNAPNGVTLEIDRERGDPDKWISWYRKQFVQWQTVDGTQQNVFTRKFEKKPAFSNNFQTILNERFYVNNNSALLDAAPGSTAGFHNIVRNLTKGFMALQIALGDINVDFASTDCFVPTVSALDIKNHNGNFVYNLRDNDLMWESPFPNDITGNFQEDEVGYPSIIHGSNQYNYTPFDGVFAFDKNDKHGAKNEQDNPEITDFILSEVHYDDIWLQFLNVGAFANGTNHYYPAQFEATNTIECGEDVTFKTQNKPFVCAPQSDVELKAGQSIHFKPGTHLQAGSIVHAFIAPPPFCPKSLWVSDQGNVNNEEGSDEKSPLKSNVLQDSNVSIIEEIKLYPNPNEGFFSIDSPYEEDLSINIYTSMGKLIYGNNILPGKNKVQANLTPGLYMVRIENDRVHRNFKMIVK